MALVSVGAPLLFPPNTGAGASGTVFSNSAIGTIGYGIGVIFQAPVTDTITHISFRTGSLNASTLEVRVETVDPATGLPTGTLWATDTNGTRVMAASDDNMRFEVALTAAASVNAGDIVCLKVITNTATAGNLSTTFSPTILLTGYPRTIANTTGTWAVPANNMSVNITPKFGTNGYIYMNGFAPFLANVNYTINTTTTPDVVGNKITVPYKCEVSGAFVIADYDGDATIKLLASDGSTVKASVAVDAEYAAGITGSSAGYHVFSTPVILNAGEVVYLVMDPSGASSVNINAATFKSTDEKKVWCENAIAVTAKDPAGSGDYTELSTTCCHFNLVISKIDAGIGIKSGLHPIEQGISA